MEVGPVTQQLAGWMIALDTGTSRHEDGPIGVIRWFAFGPAADPVIAGDVTPSAQTTARAKDHWLLSRFKIIPDCANSARQSAGRIGGRRMDARGLLQFEVNGSFRVLAELADGASDAEWTARSFPTANLVGFTVWHCARTIDWAVNCVMRGVPEVVDKAEWQDLRVPEASFGAGASPETADAVARNVPRARVSAYLDALRQDTIAWLAAVPNDDLSAAVDLKARHTAKPDYMTPPVWEEVEDLNGIPGWQFLARPCALHVRTHYGEVTNQLGALRAAARA
jgi:hypothetical protein